MTDRRVRRTRKLLSDALVTLIPEKGYDAITIKGITERADVAHATFYRHYASKDELLTQILEGIIEEIARYVAEPSLQDAEGYLIFKHVQEHSVLYQILLGSPGAVGIRQSVQNVIAAEFLATCEALHAPQNKLIPPEAAAHHMAGSMLLLIEWWLNQGMPYPPHHMAKVYEHLIRDLTLDTMRRENS